MTMGSWKSVDGSVWKGVGADGISDDRNLKGAGYFFCLFFSKTESSDLKVAVGSMRMPTACSP